MKALDFMALGLVEPFECLRGEDMVLSLSPSPNLSVHLWWLETDG